MTGAAVIRGSHHRPAGRRRPARHHDRHLLPGLGPRPSRLARLPAEVPAHEPVRAARLALLAQGQPRPQVRRRHHRHEERVHGRAGHARRACQFRNRFTGNPMADFLLGYVSDFQLSNVFVVDQRALGQHVLRPGRLEGELEAVPEPRAALRLHHPRPGGGEPPAQLHPRGQRAASSWPRTARSRTAAWSSPTATTSRPASASSTRSTTGRWSAAATGSSTTCSTAWAARTSSP